MFKSDFYEEYHDLVTLLIRVMGLHIVAFFQVWMFYFIGEIIHGKTKFHWVKIISDNIHNQLMAMKKMSKLYITSYLVYLLAEPFPYNGLFIVNNLEPRKGELKVYDHYPQLQYINFKRGYHRVNDTFIGNIIKLLGGYYERRVSHSAKAFIERFLYLFI